METSIFIAQIISIAYLAIGLGMLLNSAYYKKLFDAVQDAGIIYLGGIMALVIGFLLVTYHNVWEGSWVVIITIFGWAALLKGVVLLVFPKWMISLTKSMMKCKQIVPTAGIVVLILGAVLGYFGFFA